MTFKLLVLPTPMEDLIISPPFHAWFMKKPIAKQE